MKNSGYSLDWRSKWPWVLLGLAGTILALAIVALAGPAWIYAGNADEFSASFPQILSEYLPYLLGLLAIVLAALVLLPSAVVRILASILAVIGVVIWVQGNFLVHDFGPLDGQNWKIELPLWRTALELVAILVAAFAVWRLSQKAPAVIAGLMVVLAAIAVSEPLSRIGSKPDFQATDSATSLFEFSPEKNVLVVLLDGLPSEIFEEIAREDPTVLAALDGFTYYPDTSAVAYSTALSIPVIHSGAAYEPGKPLRDFFRENIAEGSFMNELADAGYSTVLVNPLYRTCPARIELCIRAKAVLTTTRATVVGEANQLLSMGLFRAVPLPLKRFIYNDARWRQVVSFDDPRTAHHTVEGYSLMEEVAARASNKSKTPTAKFLHILSTHMPVAVNAKCEYVGEQKKTRAGYTIQAKCALDVFAKMMAALKQRGVLDNTAVVLLSDHGSGRWKNTRPVVHSDDVLSPVLISRANATLAIKPIGAKGPMTQNDAPQSLADIPGWVCQLTSDCAKAMPDPGREVRQYRHYSWRNNSAWKKNTPIDVTGYLITGPVHDGHSWAAEKPAP